MKAELNKIYNCDCFDGMKDIPDGSVDMILCDPPYGMTALEWDVCLPLDKLWAEYKRITKPNAAILLFARQPFATDLINAARKMFRYEIIWHKTMAAGFLTAKKKPLCAHENILVFYGKPPTYNPIKGRVKLEGYEKTIVGVIGGKGVYAGVPAVTYKDDGTRYPRSVITFSNHHGFVPDRPRKITNIHPTQKPVDLCEYLIKTYSNEGDTILDNCSGSGTTAIAAMNTGRNFICYEKDAGYYEKSVARLEAERNKPKTETAPMPRESANTLSLFDCEVA